MAGSAASDKAQRIIYPAIPVKNLKLVVSADQGAEALLEGAHGGEDRGGLVAAVGHAVVAARVLATAELVPVRGLQEFPPGLRVAVVEQVAGLLPAFEAVQRDPPRRALEVGLALEEVQVQLRVVEAPLLAAALREGLAEQLTRLRDPQEPVLVGRLAVRVPGRDFQPVDPELVVDVIKGRDQVLRSLSVEDGRDSVDLETLL